MIETRTYSAMLYSLAAEIRRLGICDTELPNEIENAAERMDMQTVTINMLTAQRNDAVAHGKSAFEQFEAMTKQRDELLSKLNMLSGINLGRFANSIVDKAIASAKSYGQPEKQAKTETSVPAIVFYPAGSLGEAIESEGGAE